MKHLQNHPSPGDPREIAKLSMVRNKIGHFTVYMLQDILQVEGELGYELISPEDMVDHFTKAKNQHHIATILVAALINEILG